MSKPNKNARELLIGIGIGDFNATIVIPYMFISPATTDPKSSQTILLVQHVQRALYDLGATEVVMSGRLDAPTAHALSRVVGPNWERMTWAANVSALIAAKEGGVSLRAPPPPRGAPVAVGGVFDFLPDVPGGLVTYAIGGFLLYRHLTRKARA